jgi:hypothetical protein
MKKLLLTGLLTLAMGLAAQAVSFNYSSTVNSLITFDGASHFTFAPAANNFSVSTGTAAGLLGEITGNFTIGIVSGSSAPVTGTGTFVIHDGAFTFTATLVWNNIAQLGTINGLNTIGNANLTAITYGGSNADLLAIKNAGVGKNNFSFQFGSATTVDTLKTSSTSTSFSGTIATPDGSTTVVLLGFALAGMATLRRTIKGSKV